MKPPRRNVGRAITPRRIGDDGAVLHADASTRKKSPMITTPSAMTAAMSQRSFTSATPFLHALQGGAHLLLCELQLNDH